MSSGPRIFSLAADPLAADPLGGRFCPDRVTDLRVANFHEGQDGRLRRHHLLRVVEQLAFAKFVPSQFRPLRNGTRVEKTDFRQSDAHQIGAKAIVLGSMGPMEFEGIREMYGYFVEWDDHPGVPCFIASNRVREVKPD